MNPPDALTSTDSVAEHLGLVQDVVDEAARDRAVEHLRALHVALPTFAQLTDPASMPVARRAAVAEVDPDAPDGRNLWRVHWHNAGDRRSLADVPEYVVLPPAFTGVHAPIVVLLGNRFPMIHTHKVLAAYACLAPRLVTGGFDPSVHRAVWPSTGNYARGGVAISRIMGCRGVAVLPAGMSAERFEWLGRWVSDPADVIRTPGSESNVKEIYDACAALATDPGNVILNQFCEFGNHLAHRAVTGAAFGRVLDRLLERTPAWTPRAFVSATGSAGTIAAGDALKERYGTRTVAVEAAECPTMLENGYGEHNIQGIGDKHIPLIHNVMNTDMVVSVSDRDTDALELCFAEREGRAELTRIGVPDDTISALDAFGLSSIANVLASIKVAKEMGYGPDDVIATVATDGAELYGSEVDRIRRTRFRDGFDRAAAAAAIAESLHGAQPDHVLDCTERDRRRIFNLGYYTWVEQQGVPADVFDGRRSQAFWHALTALVPAWDALIDEFNARTGV